MESRKLTTITDEKQKKRLFQNLEAMKERFQGEPFSGEGLAQIMRKIKNDDHTENNEEFKRKLAKTQPLLYEILSGNTLQGWGTVDAMTAGRKEPSRRFVKDLAAFCTKAFSFDRDVTCEELLTCDLAPFPPLRRINERWNRYVGIYHGYFPYQGERGLELHGSLLEMREESGILLSRFITGIRRDLRFDELKQLLTDYPKENFVDKFRQYSEILPPYEARMACYEGSADSSIPGYFQLKMQRMDKENTNTASIFLRRWDKSTQPQYSGSIGTVILCRENDMVTYPLAVTRCGLSLQQEREMLVRHLGRVQDGESLLRISSEADRKWNGAIMDWCFLQDEEKEKLF